jgi:hypothetical protein
MQQPIWMYTSESYHILVAGFPLMIHDINVHNPLPHHLFVGPFPIMHHLPPFKTSNHSELYTTEQLRQGYNFWASLYVQCYFCNRLNPQFLECHRDAQIGGPSHWSISKGKSTMLPDADMLLDKMCGTVEAGVVNAIDEKVSMYYIWKYSYSLLSGGLIVTDANTFHLLFTILISTSTEQNQSPNTTCNKI